MESQSAISLRDSPGTEAEEGCGGEDLVGIGLIGGDFWGARELFQLDFNGFHGFFSSYVVFQRQDSQ